LTITLKTKILSQDVPLLLTKFGKSELKTRFGLNLNFGLRLKLRTESWISQGLIQKCLLS